MEAHTSNSLSYLANETKPREIPPWARRANFEIPNEPMESSTMQKISYGPPGYFVVDGNSDLQDTHSQDHRRYPTAADFD